MARINIELPVLFNCRKDCSRCCEINGGYVFVSEANIKKIAKFLKRSVVEIRERYTYEVKGMRSLKDRDGQACVFLEEGKCTIYPVRPLQCRTYPFWPQNVKSTRRWRQVMEDCPGIGEGKVYDRKEIEAVFEGRAVDSDK
ncbi:MAG TPA: YkgJ family cysteine cluster protein [Caldithrix abyssi]|uniref:YkgJ family cysteine cluster protein n=1 Tax=Caldithrix abyssi TaxID=187145 RepID=A0A7V5RQU8_CALAY|nr:YkgJ family cysteine cluster protein [Caldithrix abyssi]